MERHASREPSAMAGKSGGQGVFAILVTTPNYK